MSANEQSKIVLNRMGKALVATIQVSLTTSVLTRFKKDLLDRVKFDFAPHLIFDFSGLDMMDLSEFEEIQNLIKMADLMGVSSMVTGLQPGVVATLVQLNANIENIKTSRNLDEALNMLSSSTAK